METKTYERIGDLDEGDALEEEISEYVKWILREIELDTEEIFTLLQIQCIVIISLWMKRRLLKMEMF